MRAEQAREPPLVGHELGPEDDVDELVFTRRKLGEPVPGAGEQQVGLLRSIHARPAVIVEQARQSEAG